MWKNQKESFVEALNYLNKRKLGEIKSIKTPWQKFNDASIDGLEWNTITVIGGRPASGKTAIVEQIIKESFIINPNENFRVLQFQFEMLGRVQAIREYSSVIGRSYKYLCSADGKLSDEDLKRCHEYSKRKVKNSKIDIVDTPQTVDQFKKIVIAYFETYSFLNEENKKTYTPTIVTIDHSVLFKKAPYEKDKLETLNNLGEALTELKKMFPVAFIVLSQLNRNIDNPDRAEDGKYGNYVLESDIFGADALLQHADKT